MTAPARPSFIICARLGLGCAAPATAHFPPAFDKILHLGSTLIELECAQVHFVGALQVFIAQARELALMQGHLLRVPPAELHFGDLLDRGSMRSRRSFPPPLKESEYLLSAYTVRRLSR